MIHKNFILQYISISIHNLNIGIRVKIFLFDLNIAFQLIIVHIKHSKPYFCKFINPF